MGQCCSCEEKDTRLMYNTTTGLSRKENTHLQRAMRGICKRSKAESFGMELFRDLFLMYPYTRDWFPAYRTSPCDMAEDAMMVVHGVKVINFIKMCVDHSSDSDLLKVMMDKIAWFHLARNVTLTEFELFGVVFMQLLRKRSRMTPGGKREKSWIKFFNYMYRQYLWAERVWLVEPVDTVNRIPVNKPAVKQQQKERTKFMSIATDSHPV